MNTSMKHGSCSLRTQNCETKCAASSGTSRGRCFLLPVKLSYLTTPPAENQATIQHVVFFLHRVLYIVVFNHHQILFSIPYKRTTISYLQSSFKILTRFLFSSKKAPLITARFFISKDALQQLNHTFFSRGIGAELAAEGAGEDGFFSRSIFSNTGTSVRVEQADGI